MNLPALRRSFLFAITALLIGFGQPSCCGVLGALGAVCGYAFFFHSVSPELSMKRRALVGTSWFFLVQAIQLSWMTTLEFQGYYILLVYFFLCLFLGVQFGIFLCLVPSKGKISWKALLGIASFWTLMEWVRLFFLCGFSLNPVGLALTHFVPALQFASVFGIFGLSFWVVLTNVSVLNWLRSTRCWRQGVICVCLALFPYFFGVLQLRRLPEKKASTLRAALVQTDLLPSQKIPYADRMDEYLSPFQQWAQIVGYLKSVELSSCDLVVLPEGAVPFSAQWPCYPLQDVKNYLEEALGKEIHAHYPPLAPPYVERRYLNGHMSLCVSNLFWCQTLANFYHAELIIGMDYCDAAAHKNFNSAFYFTPHTTQVSRYDKQVLLPLAEYLPFEIFRPLTKRYGIDAFFTPGKHNRVFGSKMRLSPSICYEETFSEIMREARQMGAEIFINLTNDNYYPNSTLHAQHFSHARVRAVENGVPLLRACNAGVTGIVDAHGRVHARMEPGAKGVCVRDFAPYQVKTLFTLWGNTGIILFAIVFCSLFGFELALPFPRVNRKFMKIFFRKSHSS